MKGLYSLYLVNNFSFLLGVYWLMQEIGKSCQVLLSNRFLFPLDDRLMLSCRLRFK